MRILSSITRSADYIFILRLDVGLTTISLAFNAGVSVLFEAILTATNLVFRLSRYGVNPPISLRTTSHGIILTYLGSLIRTSPLLADIVNVCTFTNPDYSGYGPF